MAYIWSYLRRYPKWLAMNFTAAILFVIANLGLPTVLARMIDEGIVQTDIYSENEVQKYKKEKFKNMIYEVVGGQFKDEIKSIADGYLDVIVTMNYNIDIISEEEPEIEIKS